MSAGAQPRAATLVVRTWHEPDDGGAPSLRVRVVEVSPPPAQERTICATTSPAEAAEAVSAWLQRQR